MVNLRMIQRCVERGEFEKLVQRLGENGLAESLPLRARLGHAAPATGLALRRAVELSYYGPTSLTRMLTALLIHLQQPDGSFAGVDERDPVATAAAAAGLATLLADPMGRLDDTAAVAQERAIAALASMQDGQGLFTSAADRTWQDRAATSAFVLTMLVDDPRFRAAVRFADLLSCLDENEHRLDHAARGLLQLARADQPTAGVAGLRLAAAA